MSKNFIKFKKRVRAQSIAAAALLGVGGALVALAILVLVLKLTGTAPSMIYYFGAAGVAIIASLILYFIFMPSDRRLARRLDSLYTLDEKISTMVELREEQGFFAELQREDADRRLGEKPKKAFKSKQLLAGILVFVIALGSMLGAIIIPVKADSEDPIDEFDKQWLITAIGELITTVENSYVSDTLKAKTLQELNSLLDFVNGSDYLSAMKAKAITTVLAINEALGTANSAEALSVVFAQSSNAELLELGKQLAKLAGPASKTALEALGEMLDGADYDDANFVADEINSYLASSGVRSDDALYTLFKGLVTVIKSSPSDIEDEFESAAKLLSAQVIVQNVNRNTISIVINKLCNLFGITEDDLTAADPDVDIDIRDPSDDEPIPDDPDVEEPNTNIGSGGLGTGDVIYGSNDLVFDPDTNTYRPFGELLNEYFAKANEQITDGKTSDKTSDAAEDYFGTLFGSATKNDND